MDKIEEHDQPDGGGTEDNNALVNAEQSHRFVNNWFYLLPRPHLPKTIHRKCVYLKLQPPLPVATYKQDKKGCTRTYGDVYQVHCCHWICGSLYSPLPSASVAGAVGWYGSTYIHVRVVHSLCL